MSEESQKIPQKVKYRMPIKRRQAFSFVEVLVASTISFIVTTSSIATVIYHQRVGAMNHRMSALTNLIESELETIRNQTWFTLVNPTDGWFTPDPNNVRGGNWPSPDDLSQANTGDRSLYVSKTVISDSTTNEDYTGIVGQVDIFYTPIVLTHDASTDSGQLVQFDIRYWKVEVIVTLTGSHRIRLNEEQDIWTAVTYISELMGRGDAEFSTRTLNKLRSRQRFAPTTGTP
ncbi:MAG: hypothetical protein ACFCU1_05965 [Sumerlaeia bacterium]